MTDINAVIERLEGVAAKFEGYAVNAANGQNWKNSDECHYKAEGIRIAISCIRESDV